MSNRNNEAAHKAYFIKGDNNSTINEKDNEFQDNRLSTTIGIIQQLPLENASISIAGKKRVVVKNRILFKWWRNFILEY